MRLAKLCALRLGHGGALAVVAGLILGLAGCSGLLDSTSVLSPGVVSQGPTTLTDASIEEYSASKDGEVITLAPPVVGQENLGSGSVNAVPRGCTAPKPPTGVSASDDSYPAKVQVKWSQSTNATGYEIWRGTSNKSGNATKVGTVTSGKTTTWDDTSSTNMQAARTYYYWVKATIVCDKKTLPSGFSASDTGRALPTVVTSGVVNLRNPCASGWAWINNTRLPTTMAKGEIYPVTYYVNALEGKNHCDTRCNSGGGGLNIYYEITLCVGYGNGKTYKSPVVKYTLLTTLDCLDQRVPPTSITTSQFPADVWKGSSVTMWWETKVWDNSMGRVKDMIYMEKPARKITVSILK
jgi:hypothetical protein